MQIRFLRYFFDLALNNISHLYIKHARTLFMSRWVKEKGKDMKEISLREGQKTAIDLIRDSFRKGHRKVMLQAPCSFGKTRISASIIKSIIENGKKAYFICDRITLIEQAAREFEKFGIPLGVIQGNNEKYNFDAPLQVCSIQTLANRKKLPHADFCLVDEAHSIYKSQVDLMNKWDNVRFLGLSATPFTKGLGKIWDDLVIGARVQQLTDDGLLVPLEYYGAPKIDLSKVKMQGDDYNQKQLGVATNTTKVVGDIIKHWNKYGENRQTLCFAVNILHSKHIVGEFIKIGVKAVHIDCYTKPEEREKYYTEFANGEIKILSSVEVLSKGFDSPIASCLIFARPTKSLILHIQVLGRPARLSPGKENAIILDHGGNVLQNGMTTDPLPEILCNDDKDKSSKKQKKKEKPESDVKLCSECFKFYPIKSYKCPKCGHIMDKVEVVSGDLEKIDKVDTTVKSQWFAMFLYYARSKGWQDGSASHLYKSKFGVWPHRKTGVHPQPPNEEVMKYITYINIKKDKARKAKARKANVNH